MKYTSGPSRDQVDSQTKDSFIDTENRLRVARNKRFPRSIPRQRVGALTNILKFRHGDACQTDDAALWFDVVVPFVIEVAVIEGREPFPAVLAWASRFLPNFYAETGHVEIERRVNAIVRDREAARRMKAYALPTLPELAALLRLTFDEVTAMKLRGWPSINPPDADTKRARNSGRMRKVRREQGVRSQASRTRTKDDDALAAIIGRSRRVIQMWRKGEILDAKLREMVESGAVDFAKLCALSRKGGNLTHTFAKLGCAANDDTDLSLSA